MFPFSNSVSSICKSQFGDLKLFSYLTVMVTRNLSGDFNFVLHVSLWGMPSVVPLSNQKPAETIPWHGKSSWWDFCWYGCIENGSFLQEWCWKPAHPFPGWVLICQVFWSINIGCTSFSSSLYNELKMKKERHLWLSVDTDFADMFYIHQPGVVTLQHALMNISYTERCKWHCTIQNCTKI